MSWLTEKMAAKKRTRAASENLVTAQMNLCAAALDLIAAQAADSAELTRNLESSPSMNLEVEARIVLAEEARTLLAFVEAAGSSRKTNLRGDPWKVLDEAAWRFASAQLTIEMLTETTAKEEKAPLTASTALVEAALYFADHMRGHFT